MKSLAEHNQQRLDANEALLKRLQPHANGIACPKCGAELWDSSPTETLPSNPPQKNVRCPKCGYVGFRVA